MYKTSSVTIDSGAIISGHMMPTVDCRSMAFSHRYAEVDIRSSMAHAKKLGASGLISEGEAIKLLSGLVSMLDDLKSGLLVFPQDEEGVMMQMDRILADTIGPDAEKLNMERSASERASLNQHMYILKEAEDIVIFLRELAIALLYQAERTPAFPLPARANSSLPHPENFADYFFAYARIFERDMARMRALKKLELNNSDFIAEFLSANSIIAAHMLKLYREISIWAAGGYVFMPLLNADSIEKSVLTGMLTLQNHLSLSCGAEFQTHKESVYAGLETLKSCLYQLAFLVDMMIVKNQASQDHASGQFAEQISGLRDLLSHAE